MERGQLPAVSANLLDTTTGRRVFPDFLLRDVGGLRVGIVGVTGDNALQAADGGSALRGTAPGLATGRGAYLDVAFPEEAGVRVGPALPAATEAVAAARRAGARLVVVLAHMSLDDARLLARKVQGIHVVVAAHDRRTTGRAEREGETLLVEGGYRGKQLGRLELVIQAGDMRFVDGGDAGRTRADLDAARRRLQFYEETLAGLEGPDRGVPAGTPASAPPPSPPGERPGGASREESAIRRTRLEYYRRLVSEQRARIADLEARLKESERARRGDRDLFVLTLHDMDSSIADAPEVRAILEAAKGPTPAPGSSASPATF